MNPGPQQRFDLASGARGPTRLADGAWLLPGFVSNRDAALLAQVERVQAAAPFRHLKTPGGLAMSAAMTNCGSLGWISDRRGYRYEACDPLSGRPWPSMPPLFVALAQDAARAGGFPDWLPDACLVNAYQPGARMTLHQDKDEHDLAWPIVSVSLGLPAVFLFGGARRSDKPQPITLEHGDVVVWGGASRLRYHGIRAVKEGNHPLVGARRINLTFRKAR